MSVCDECGSDGVEERWLTERFEHKDTTVEVEFRSMVCVDCLADYTTGEQGKALVRALADAIDGAEANEALEEAEREGMVSMEDAKRELGIDQ